MKTQFVAIASLALLASAAGAAEEAARQAKAAATPVRDGQGLSYDIVRAAPQVFKVHSAGTFDLAGRSTVSTTKDGQTTTIPVVIEIGVQFDTCLLLQLKSATVSDEIIHTVWKPLACRRKMDLTPNARVGERPLITNKRTVEMTLSEASCSGTVRQANGVSNPIPFTNLRKDAATFGIGASLLADLTARGQVVSWKASDELEGQFTAREQEMMVGLISGMIFPTLPEQALAAGDSWRTTPGKAAPPVMKRRLEATPKEAQALAAGLSQLESIIRSQINKAEAAGSPLANVGNTLSPFSWGIDMDFVYDGLRSTTDGDAKHITYSGDVKNKSVASRNKDGTTQMIEVRNLEVRGEASFDAATCCLLRASATNRADAQWAFSKGTGSTTLKIAATVSVTR